MTEVGRLRQIGKGGVQLLDQTIRRRCNATPCCEWRHVVIRTKQEQPIEVLMPYNPAQPRDWHGRWTDGAGSSEPSAFDRYLENVDYNGHYHDVVVDDIKTHMARGGVPCIKNVPISTVDGTTAIPDLICKSKQDGSIKFIEVKTGLDASFSDNQLKVYAMAQFDRHVMPLNNRLAAFGAPAGTALPVTDVFLAYASALGAKMQYSEPFKWLRINGKGLRQ